MWWVDYLFVVLMVLYIYIDTHTACIFLSFGFYHLCTESVFSYNKYFSLFEIIMDRGHASVEKTDFFKNNYFFNCKYFYLNSYEVYVLIDLKC
jgi:hypothetical protein